MKRETNKVKKKTDVKKFCVMETVKNSWRAVHGTKRIFLTISAMLVVVACSMILLESKMMSLDHHLMLTHSLAYVANFLGKVIPMILGLSMVYVGIQRSLHPHLQWHMIGYVFNLNLLWKVVCLDILLVVILSPVVILFYGSLRFFDYFPNFEPSIFFEFCRFVVFIASLILMIYLMMRLYLTKAIVVAEKSAPWKTIQASFQATKSHGWKLFGLFLINILIIAVSSIPLGIGLIWSVPFCFINYGFVYKKLML